MQIKTIDEGHFFSFLSIGGKKEREKENETIQNWLGLGEELINWSNSSGS